MNEQKQYENRDMPFYEKSIAPILPDKVLDFHTHAWLYNQWLTGKGEKSTKDAKALSSAKLGTFNTAKYMATEVEYTLEQLFADGRRMFPDKEYQAVCFGQPTPAVDIRLTNKYIVENARNKGMFPLIVAGGGLIPAAELRESIKRDGYFGYKVFLNWVGNDYKNIRVEDMLTEEEMALADELKLIVLLHVPRSGRLADPEIQQGVRKYALTYPGSSIVLAHCGRCYHPDEMRSAVKAVCDLENVYMDTSMVMDPVVLEMAMRSLGPERLLYATDFPVAAMRGRRVNVMDHWVDVVLEGYPESDFRVASDGIRATFMAYEIAVAIALAADMSGISEGRLKSIFYDNGEALLKKVMSGMQWEKKA
jgi:uncharacterized protein